MRHFIRSFQWEYLHRMHIAGWSLTFGYQYISIHNIFLFIMLGQEHVGYHHVNVTFFPIRLL